MKWMLGLILVLFLAWTLLERSEPVPAEESVIGDQVKALRKAESLEDDHLKSVEDQLDRLEEQDTGDR